MLTSVLALLGYLKSKLEFERALRFRLVFQEARPPLSTSLEIEIRDIRSRRLRVCEEASVQQTLLAEEHYFH